MTHRPAVGKPAQRLVVGFEDSVAGFNESVNFRIYTAPMTTMLALLIVAALGATAAAAYYDLV
jgi:hypothetical protein